MALRTGGSASRSAGSASASLNTGNTTDSSMRQPPLLPGVGLRDYTVKQTRLLGFQRTHILASFPEFPFKRGPCVSMIEVEPEQREVLRKLAEPVRRKPAIGDDVASIPLHGNHRPIEVLFCAIFAVVFT